MDVVVGGKQLAPEESARIKARAAAIEKRASARTRPGALDESYFEQLTDSTNLDDAMIALLRDRSVVDTSSFDFPRKPGALGSLMFCVREFLWKLLRYQHDRMSSRQNRINGLIISTLEQRTKALEKEIVTLRNELHQQNENANTSRDATGDNQR